MGMAKGGGLRLQVIASRLKTQQNASSRKGGKNLFRKRHAPKDVMTILSWSKEGESSPSNTPQVFSAKRKKLLWGDQKSKISAS